MAIETHPPTGGAAYELVRQHNRYHRSDDETCPYCLLERERIRKEHDRCHHGDMECPFCRAEEGQQP